VRLKTHSGEQWNRVTTSVGYGGASDRTIHFGLGAETRIEEIVIEWPGGTRQKLQSVPADRYLTVREDPVR
jgi:hypothetical protein